MQKSHIGALFWVALLCLPATGAGNDRGPAEFTLARQGSAWRYAPKPTPTPTPTPEPTPTPVPTPTPEPTPAPVYDGLLTSITVNKGELVPEFHPEQRYYWVFVDSNDKYIRVDATPYNEDAVVTGTGKYSLSKGQVTVIWLTVIYGYYDQDGGNTQQYLVYVYRPS